MDKIDPIPEMPQNIIEAIGNEKLAVFIGAGVSRLVGCSGWDQLACDLLTCCYDKIIDGKRIINYKEKETLSQSKDHKKTITICHHLLKKNNQEKIFFEKMEKALRFKDDSVPKPNIYNEIKRLRALFITTNADTHFDELFSKNDIIYEPSEFNPDSLDKSNLYHIHGSIKSRKSLVFTLNKYFEIYKNDVFTQFLMKVFNEYTILFIGYGMSEFEILDFMFLKNNPQNIKHYLLEPYYNGEENILNYHREYFKEMGVQVIPYSKDENGYEQLENVIKDWSKTVNHKTSFLFDSFDEIEKNSNNFSDEIFEKTLQLIKNELPLEKYLFKYLALNENILWLIPLKKKNWFTPKTIFNFERSKEACWYILNYIEHVARKNSANPLDEITNALIEIVNSMIDHVLKEKKDVSEYIFIENYILKIISCFPSEIIYEKIEKFLIFIKNIKLKSKHSSFGGELNSIVFPKLLVQRTEHNSFFIKKILEIILDYNRIGKAEGCLEFESVIDTYWLSVILKNYTSKFYKICGPEVADIAIKKIENLILENKKSFSYYSIPTIERTPKNQTSYRSEDYEYQLVNFVRDVYELSNPSEIKEKILEILNKHNNGNYILKRIAIYTINYHYKDLGPIFWDLSFNPLNIFELKHEIFELMKNNCINLTNEQIKKAVDWIESTKYKASKKIKNNKEKVKSIARQKKEWLMALLNSNNSNIKLMYDEYNKIYPDEIKLAGITFSDIKCWSGDASPIDQDDLLKKSNEEIAEYLNLSKIPKDVFGPDEPSMDGLSDTLHSCVLKNLEKFSENLEPFVNIKRIYQHSILRGFRDNLNQEIIIKINWDKFLNFINKILESDKFNADVNEENNENNYNESIANVIIDIISGVTKGNKFSFDEDKILFFIKTLLKIASLFNADRSKNIDVVERILNSTNAKTYSAMIKCSLYSARTFLNDNEKKWIDIVKNEFDKQLNLLGARSYEFSAILGMYLANLYYLDKNWIVDNYNKIFIKDNDEHWLSTFRTYIAYSKIYKDLYVLARKSEFYHFALQKFIKDNDHTMERLIGHICVGYIEDWEKFDDENSLIIILLKNNNAFQIHEIVHFFNSGDDNVSEKIKSKIKPLWRKLIDIINNNIKNNIDENRYKIVISDLSKWLNCVDLIDEEVFEWLEMSCENIAENHNKAIFVRLLIKHVEKTPAESGKLFLAMFASDPAPHLENEETEFVEKLCQNNQKKLANEICNRYFERGYYFLRDLYKKYNLGKGQ